MCASPHGPDAGGRRAFARAGAKQRNKTRGKERRQRSDAKTRDVGIVSTPPAPCPFHVTFVTEPVFVSKQITPPARHTLMTEKRRRFLFDSTRKEPEVES